MPKPWTWSSECVRAASRFVVGTMAAALLPWATHAAELELPDSCATERLDDTHLRVVCGVSRVPRFEVDVASRFEKGDDDPFVPLGIGFEPQGEPWVVDLTRLAHVDRAPYFECFGRSAGAADASAIDGVWDPEVVRRIVEDVRLLSAGAPPRCYDLPASATSRSRSAPVDGEVPEDDYGPLRPGAIHVLPPEAMLDDEVEGPSVLEQILAETRLGIGLRQEFDHGGRCPKSMGDGTPLKVLASLAVEQDFISDLQPMIAADAEVARRGAGTGLMCTYDPYRDVWQPTTFYCGDDDTCYTQLAPELPNGCQPLDRTAPGSSEWRLRRTSCMGERAVEREMILRYVALEHDVFLSVVVGSDGSTSQALVFPYGAQGQRHAALRHGLRSKDSLVVLR